MSDNVNRIYADAYANRVLKKEPRPKVERSNSKKPRLGLREFMPHRNRSINMAIMKELMLVSPPLQYKIRIQRKSPHKRKRP